MMRTQRIIRMCYILEKEQEGLIVKFNKESFQTETIKFVSLKNIYNHEQRYLNNKNRI